jgi:hypothetical protein
MPKDLIMPNKSHTAWNKGKIGLVKMSEETKKKMSESSKKSINPGRFKKGMIPWSKDKHLSEETRKKLSLLGKQRPFNPKFTTKGLTAWNKGTGKKNYCLDCGKELPNKTAKRCSYCMGKFMTGKNHWNWQGGITIEKYPIDWNDTLKESIRQRDNYVCQECGIHQDELKFKIDIHHIDYDKNNLDTKNLISLCRYCHIKTNTNRDYWTNYFKSYETKF